MDFRQEKIDSKRKKEQDDQWVYLSNKNKCYIYLLTLTNTDSYRSLIKVIDTQSLRLVNFLNQLK